MSQKVSREIIANQLQINGSITPWQDLFKFSEIVIKERLKQYKQATNKIEFYDRGIIDSFAYLLKDNIRLEEEWITIAKENTNTIKRCLLHLHGKKYTTQTMKEKKISSQQQKFIHTY